jgi:hypothetical protein
MSHWQNGAWSGSSRGLFSEFLDALNLRCFARLEARRASVMDAGERRFPAHASAHARCLLKGRGPLHGEEAEPDLSRLVIRADGESQVAKLDVSDCRTPSEKRRSSGQSSVWSPPDGHRVSVLRVPLPPPSGTRRAVGHLTSAGALNAKGCGATILVGFYRASSPGAHSPCATPGASESRAGLLARDLGGADLPPRRQRHGSGVGPRLRDQPLVRLASLSRRRGVKSQAAVRGNEDFMPVLRSRPG